ncbi:hypothetical protein ACS0PU_003201 [Formica fusca]
MRQTFPLLCEPIALRDVNSTWPDTFTQVRIDTNHPANLYQPLVEQYWDIWLVAYLQAIIHINGSWPSPPLSPSPAPSSPPSGRGYILHPSSLNS